MPTKYKRETGEMGYKIDLRKYMVYSLVFTVTFLTCFTFLSLYFPLEVGVGILKQAVSLNRCSLNCSFFLLSVPEKLPFFKSASGKYLFYQHLRLCFNGNLIRHTWRFRLVPLPMINFWVMLLIVALYIINGRLVEGVVLRNMFSVTSSNKFKDYVFIL